MIIFKNYLEDLAGEVVVSFSKVPMISLSTDF